MKWTLLALSFMVFIAGCHSSSPQTTAEEYMRALTEQRWQVACKMLDQASFEAVQKAGTGDCASQLERSFSQVATIETSKRVELLTQSDRSASFRTDIDGETLHLKKVGSAWYVNLLQR